MKDRMIRYLFTTAAALSMLAARGAVFTPADGDGGLPTANTQLGLAEPVPQESLPQGIEGPGYRVGCNHMPDPHHPSGPPAGVRSTVYIFELTNIGQVIRQ